MADNTAITNIAMAFQTAKDLAATAATADVADTAEVFEYTPTGRTNRFLITLEVAALNGTVKAKFSKSPGVFGVADVELDAPQAKTTLFQIEHGKFVQADGTFKITLTPAAGKKLKTDHTAKISVIELA